MTSRTPATCQHELRPGTKVCLHCRRAEREVRATRQRAVLVRVGLTGAAIAASAYAGVVGYRAWQGHGRPTIGALLASPSSLEAAPVRTHNVAAPAATPPAGLVSPVADSAPAAATPPVASMPVPTAAAPASGGAATEALVPPPAATVTAPPVPVATATVRPLEPVVSEGRTELQNGIYAMRRGDTVTVHFDTPEARTRRPEKFEQIVRSTLPSVHGLAAESLLATVATGSLVRPGETITEPDRVGISLRDNDGRVLSLVPQTRPGRDGPLVVAYRVTAAR